MKEEASGNGGLSIRVSKREHIVGMWSIIEIIVKLSNGCTSLVHISTKYGNTTNECILCSWMSSRVLACHYKRKVCIWVGAGIAMKSCARVCVDVWWIPVDPELRMSMASELRIVWIVSFIMWYACVISP